MKKIVSFRDSQGHGVEPWSVFLCAADVARSRLLVLLYAFFDNDNNQRFEKVNRIFISGDSMLYHLGENAYTLLKAMPGIAVTSTIEALDPICSTKLNPNAKVSYFSELISELRVSGIGPSILENLLSNSTTIEEASINISLSGLWKCFGYPIIAVKSGFRKFKEKGGTIKVLLDKETLAQIGGYYRKHSKWPICRSESKNSTLQKHLD